jgi:hypothetical protein
MWDELAKGAVEGLIHGLLTKRSSDQATHNGIPDVVESRSFVLRDEHDRGRAVLTTIDGQPSLSFLTEDGQMKLAISLGSSGPYIQLWGENGETECVLRVEGNDADISFYDQDSNERAILSLDATGPSLLMRDTQNKCRVSLMLTDDGTPFLTLFDEEENSVAELPCPDEERDS